MATGAPGTNGVWQYGEDDSEATFSALLNKAASTTDTQIGADRTRLTALEARKLSGLVPVVPSTVDKSGGTASSNSVGLVTFSGVSSLSLNSVFTSSFAKYLVIFSYETTVNAANGIRLRSTGVDNSTSNYVVGRVYQDDNTGGFQNTGGQTAWGSTPTGSARQFSAEITLFNPQAASPTQGWHWGAIAASASSGAKMASQNGSMLFQASNSFDGITLYPTAGTMTGTIQVFALED